MWLQRQLLSSYPIGLWDLVEEKKREWGTNKEGGRVRGKQRKFLEDRKQRVKIKSSKLASQFFLPPVQTLSSIFWNL